MTSTVACNLTAGSPGILVGIPPHGFGQMTTAVGQVMTLPSQKAAQPAMAQAVPSGLLDSLNAIRKGYAAKFLRQPDIKYVPSGLRRSLCCLIPVLLLRHAPTHKRNRDHSLTATQCFSTAAPILILDLHRTSLAS